MTFCCFSDANITASLEETVKPVLELFTFEQNKDAIVIKTSYKEIKSSDKVIRVQFYQSAAMPSRDGDESLAPRRSGGVLAISLSENPKYKIIGCVEGELQLPNNTTDESLVELRVVKRYPWFSLKYSGATVAKHNFFSFKNAECRSVWAIKANIVAVDLIESADTSPETQQVETVLKTMISLQGL